MRKITILMAVLGLVFSSTAQNIPSYIPTDSLVGYWGFDGDANDYSGNGNDGTVNGATLNEDRHGNINSAYSFDGVDDYIELPYSDIWEFGNDNFSISAWFLTTDSLSKGNIIRFDNGYGPNSLWGMRVKYGGLNFLSGVNNSILSDSVNVADNGYHYCTMVRDNGYLKIYLDGELILNELHTTVDINTNGTYYPSIGRLGSYNGEYFTGSIDDIAIYNRALSAEEIQAIYNEQAPSGLIAHYPFTGSAVDISGNDNHGTVNGATLTEDRFGNMNSAYEFDGVDDYIQVDSIIDLSNIDLSTSFWFKPDSIPSNNERVLWYFYGENNNGFACNLTRDSTFYFHNWEHSSSSKPYEISTNGKYDVGIWYNLITVYQINGTQININIYLNGDLIISEIHEYSAPDLSKLRIGTHGTVLANNNGSVTFTGSIDDIKIYNRALSEEEISSLYTEGQCFETITDTTVVLDTTEVIIDVLDTMVVMDTTVTEVFDTMLIMDTTEVIIDVLDTMVVMDTTVTEVFDTTEVLDTMVVIDTTVTEVFDTTEVMDTNVVTVYDTMLVMDTSLVTVHDTLVITMSSDTAAGIDFLTTEVNVYPNPASTQLNVEIDMSGDYTVSLTNINGQMVFTQANVVDDLQIDISDFTKGLYFITIRDNDGVLKAEERKIVIE
jgi:hypothetical protein